MGKPTQLWRNYAAGGQGGIEAISRLMGFLLVCMGVRLLLTASWKSLKRIIKKGPNGLSTIASVLRVSLASGEK